VKHRRLHGADARLELTKLALVRPDKPGEVGLLLRNCTPQFIDPIRPTAPIPSSAPRTSCAKSGFILHPSSFIFHPFLRTPAYCAAPGSVVRMIRCRVRLARASWHFL
jgi:hypothetical protein